MENSRRLLSCIAYPFASEVDFASKGDIIILVCWLEDRKIRELEIEDREALRKDGEQWDTAFANYLSTLGCPFQWTKLENEAAANDCIAWLISSATSAEYEDASDACVGMEEQGLIGKAANSRSNSTNDDMDVVDGDSGSTLSASIDSLGASLDVERGTQDDVSYLGAIHRKVKLFLTSGSLHALQTKGANGIPLTSFPSPFESKDRLLKQVAVVMRMLYLSDFRELQNDLNSLIVLGQEYTANPKTNSALGAVGR